MPAPADRLVIALAQIPFIVGDIAGNRDRLMLARAEAAGFGADLVMTPELYLAGYPPRTSSQARLPGSLSDSLRGAGA